MAYIWIINRGSDSCDAHHAHHRFQAFPSYKSQPSRTVASDSAPEAAECNDLSSSWLEAASLASKSSWETRKAPVLRRNPIQPPTYWSYCLGGGRFIYPILIFMCFFKTKSVMTNIWHIVWGGCIVFLPCCYVICVEVDERDVRVLGKYGKWSHVGRTFGSACDNHIPRFGTKPYYPLLSHMFL